MTWYSKLGSKITGRTRDAQEEKLRSDSFDFAEAMEIGSAAGLTLSLVQRPPSEQQLLVSISDDRTATLTNQAGDILLVAKPKVDGCHIDIFAPRPELPSAPSSASDVKASEPSFTLVASNSQRDDWVLTSLRCELCQLRGRRRCGVSQIAQIFHYVESVGEGNAYCMDVLLPPKVSEGGICCGACEVCGGVGTGEWACELTSMRPKWSAKRKSLTLDFRGRATMASAKNFQLASVKDEQTSLFLFGKVAEQRYVLDYHAPLGAVQAFAIALSASHWQ